MTASFAHGTAIPERLTDRGHALLGVVLRPGDRALDGTCGNGHDCLFLARAVGPAGSVVAIDTQAIALERSALRLLEAGVRERVQLVLGDHGDLPRHLAGQFLRAAIFNLGYLPGGTREHTTSAQSTVRALEHTLDALVPGGRVVVVAYTGHPGGRAEAAAVLGAARAFVKAGRANWVERRGRPGPRTPRLLCMAR